MRIKTFGVADSMKRKFDHLQFPERETMLCTRVLFFGQRVVIVCDGECDKAWGNNWHGPKGDKAPVDPGTYEGECSKPTDKCHNKWCARECERSGIFDE
jgi:hypothetical protein